MEKQTISIQGKDVEYLPTLDGLQVGDYVCRLLAESAAMGLRVTEIDEKLISCGPWTFDHKTGVEEDEELGWGVSFGRTGSRLLGRIITS